MSSNQPVPVSGEDQPDPRVMAALRARWPGTSVPSANSFEARRVAADLAAADVADAAAGIRRVTDEQARASFHVPQIGQRSDGRWGVFCAACSAAIGDYVYPCPTWAAPFNEYPAILSEDGGS